MHSERRLLLQPKLFFGLCLAFIAACIVGTLSHEGGHIAVARYYGYSTDLHYASMHSFPPAGDSVFLNSYQSYVDAIREKRDYPGREAYEAFQQRRYRESFFITAGGPMQTMLSGCMGLLLLWLFRKRFSKAQDLKVWQWLLVLLSLFWLRQPTNMVTGTVSWLLKGRFSHRADEVRLAEHLGWPFLSIIAGTALIGLLVFGLVFFRFIPLRQRGTFLAAGLVGGIAGYTLWMYGIGPVLLP